MKKNIVWQITICFLVLFYAQNLHSQQLLQSFIEFNVGGTGFGLSVSGAGDVNGDGYDDVIVGTSAVFGVPGAYIFYGGSSMNNTPDVMMNGLAIDEDFGFSVSGVGDVNNDGYDDVIVGAPGYNNGQGRAYFYLGGSNMDNIADVIMNGDGVAKSFGCSVAGAGDVNGDGNTDIIIGTGYYYSTPKRAYIYYGGNLNNTPDVIMTGPEQYDYFSYSVSGAGDVNGDGFDDVIVGAPGGSGSGRAYIYYGGTNMNNTSDLTLGDQGSNIGYGTSVSGVGDVDNDGYDDMIIGAPGYNSGQGRAYINYGHPGIMHFLLPVIIDGEGIGNHFGQSVAGVGDINHDGYKDVIVGAPNYKLNTGRAYIFYGGSNMDSLSDVTMTGQGIGDYFGCSVSGAGDVDNDSYDDVIVGASGFSGYTGRAYIYYGGSSMNNISDVIMTGIKTDNYFGGSVSGAGDVNGDGYDDIIVGAYRYDSWTGRAYIYYGGSNMNSTPDVILTGQGTDNLFGWSVSGAGDVNKDGYDDVIVGAIGYDSNIGRAYIYFGGSTMDNNVDATLTGEGTNNYFGSSVSGAGDVNKDGYDDVIVGAYGYNSNTGRAYIYFGGSNMNNTTDVTMTGEETNSYFGISVSGAGDVNGDGYDDIIVGAYGYNSNVGRAYIYYGGNSMNNVADVIMDGGTGNFFGGSVSKAGDVNNDGYDDVIVGARGDQLNKGRVYIYNGGSNMNNVIDATMSGEEMDNYFGYSVSGAGDVNKDGYDDVIVGAPGYNSHTGRVYIYYGGGAMVNIPDLTITGEETGSEFGISVSGAGNINKDAFDEIIIGASSYPANGKAYLYKIGLTSSVINQISFPAEYKLEQNYPNPFNPSTTIEYTIPKEEHVSLKVYDISGKEVATLVNEYKRAGFYEVKLELGSNASGVYFYSLKAGKFSQTKKMLFMK
jgi:hypothetical protein